MGMEQGAGAAVTVAQFIEFAPAIGLGRFDILGDLGS